MMTMAATSCFLIALAMVSGRLFPGAEDKKTYTYKKVGDCEIQADVYPVSRPNCPVVVWIHGGALIMGNRNGVDRALFGKLREAGYVVVSIDYRLAPETKLATILEDVEDACQWVREKGPGLFSIDPKRLVVMGGSAGGYLTLTTGYRVKPPPAALVAFWGYGDVDGPWYAHPDPYYSKLPAVPKEEAYSAVGKGVLSEDKGKSNRGRFYLYCRQHGLWPIEVTGLDPEIEPRAFDPFCPVRNVTAKYPPTLLIHGTNDTDVPYEQSALMAKELARKSVKRRLITVEGAGHGLAGAKPDRVAEIRGEVLAFIKASLSTP
jgi:acetyl esterase/lipase